MNYYRQPVIAVNMQNHRSPIKSGLIYGTILGLLIIAIWWVWATTSYKWSDTRIGGLILKKYGAINQKLLDDNENSYLSHENLFIAKDRTYAECRINLKSKDNDAILNSESVRYTLTTDETVCGPLSVTRCLLL